LPSQGQESFARFLAFLFYGWIRVPIKG